MLRLSIRQALGWPWRPPAWRTLPRNGPVSWSKTPSASQPLGPTGYAVTDAGPAVPLVPMGEWSWPAGNRVVDPARCGRPQAREGCPAPGQRLAFAGLVPSSTTQATLGVRIRLRDSETVLRWRPLHAFAKARYVVTPMQVAGPRRPQDHGIVGCRAHSIRWAGTHYWPLGARRTVRHGLACGSGTRLGPSTDHPALRDRPLPACLRGAAHHGGIRRARSRPDRPRHRGSALTTVKRTRTGLFSFAAVIRGAGHHCLPAGQFPRARIVRSGSVARRDAGVRSR